MKRNLENSLFRKYPDLFRDKDAGLQENLMCSGFECLDGWYDLIDNLCKEILEHCYNARIPLPSVNQVKEKFGGLRFYIDTVIDYEEDNATIKKYDALYAIIDKYEAKSFNVCEECGKPGSFIHNGRAYTRCSECSKSLLMD